MIVFNCALLFTIWYLHLLLYVLDNCDDACRSGLIEYGAEDSFPSDLCDVTRKCSTTYKSRMRHHIFVNKIFICLIIFAHFLIPVSLIRDNPPYLAVAMQFFKIPLVVVDVTIELIYDALSLVTVYRLTNAIYEQLSDSNVLVDDNDDIISDDGCTKYLITFVLLHLFIRAVQRTKGLPRKLRHFLAIVAFQDFIFAIYMCDLVLFDFEKITEICVNPLKSLDSLAVIVPVVLLEIRYLVFMHVLLAKADEEVRDGMVDGG